MIYDYFRVTGAHTVLDYADLFSVTLHVDVTCLNCFRQTHFASAVGHELVDPKTSKRVLSWRRVSCEQQLDTFQSSCQFRGNQSVFKRALVISIF